MQLIGGGSKTLGDNEFCLEKKITAPVANGRDCLVQHCNENSILLLWVLSAAFGPYCTQTLKLVTSEKPSNYVHVSHGVWGQNKRLYTAVDLSAKCWISFRAFKVAQPSQLFPTSNYNVRDFRLPLWHPRTCCTAKLRVMLHIRTRANISTKMSRGRAGEEIFALATICAGQNAENPCRAPGQLWVQSVQQRAAALPRLFQIMVENRPGSSDQAKYRKVIDESLFYSAVAHSFKPSGGRGERQHQKNGNRGW